MPLSAQALYFHLFQSTRPLRGATVRKQDSFCRIIISIHAPLAGRDVAVPIPLVFVFRISIHAPLAGRDSKPVANCAAYQNFNPRAPCGARLVQAMDADFQSVISIHAPLAGCDAISSAITGVYTPFQSTRPLRGATICASTDALCPRDFNPRTPCGVRRVLPSQVMMPDLFQSTHPLRGATAKAHKKMRHFCAKGINTSSLCAKNAHPAT